MSDLNINQQQAVNDIDHNVHVAAGAGTGKTKTLTERYFHIVESNLATPFFGLENILAITFTKAAALEMRTRIRSKMYAELEKLQTIDKKKCERLTEMLSQFDRSQILTIDSLQAKILKDNPVEARINPDYSVADEIEYDLEINRLVKKFLNTQSNDTDLIFLLREYSLRTICEYLVELEKKDKLQLETLSMDVLLRNQEIEEKERAEHWLNLYRSFAKYFRKYKDENDIIGFSDVARRAVELLKNNQKIRNFYQNQYRYIMVDEFQDTNDAQRTLIYLLSGSEDGSALTGKKLFIVGDEKQSIYRFRGAEVKVFNSVCAEMDDNQGNSYDLLENYRSTSQVIDFVNQIFGEEGLDIDGYKKLVPCNDKVGQMNPLPVICSYISNKLSSLDSDEKMKIEARDLAEYIYGLLHNNHGEKILPKNIAVLLPKMTNVGYITEALKAKDVNYILLGGRDFYQTQEVSDILNVFRAITDEKNSIAWLGVLRSPYCGCDDQEITKLCSQAKKDSLFITLNKTNLLGVDRLHSRAKVLIKLFSSAKVLSPSELWQLVLKELNVEFILRYQEEGEQMWTNILKLQKLCLDFCNAKSCDLRTWLEFLEDTISSSQETQADLPSASAVQIMSIHKAKGLQFDTVVLPFLHKSNGERDKMNIIFNVEEQEFGAKIKGQTNESLTTRYSEIKEHNKLAELAEKKRLLYVALTRAEKRLYLSGWQDEEQITGGEDNFWSMIQFGKTKAECVKGNIQDEIDLVENGNSISVESSNLPFSITQFNSLAQPVPVCFTPSCLQTYLHCQRQYYYQYICGLVPFSDENKNAQKNFIEKDNGKGVVDQDLDYAEQGSLIHTALEYYCGDAKDAFNKAILKCEMKNRNVIVAWEMFDNYVKSDLFKMIPMEHEREIKFQLPLDEGVSFRGVIDCLYKEDDDSYGIVDYKTGYIPDDLNIGYAMQLAIYAKAVEKMKHAQVTHLALHYLQGCKQVPEQGFSIAAGLNKYQQALNLAHEIQEKRMEQDFVCCSENKKCEYCGFKYMCRKD